MSDLTGKTAQEAREILRDFLKDTGTYRICASCPIYGPDGCCRGCSHLVRGKDDGSSCQNSNLSCLSYICNTLAIYLSKLSSPLHENKLMEFLQLTYGMPREGYRGCQGREDGELLQIGDPLGEVIAEVFIEKGIISDSLEEKTSG